MTKLAQILAIEDSARTRAKDTETRVHHALQKAPLLAGLSRTYQPMQDGDLTYPPESTRVQVNADDEIARVVKALTRARLTRRFREVAGSSPAPGTHAPG